MSGYSDRAVAITGCIMLVIGIFVGLLAGTIIGRVGAIHEMRLEAVEQGHARFIADKTGTATFFWHDKMCSFTKPQTNTEGTRP